MIHLRKLVIALCYAVFILWLAVTATLLAGPIALIICAIRSCQHHYHP